MSDSAEVIQGRLGWEGGDVSEASVSELDPHPKNQELYGDTTELDDTFVNSIRQKGVLEPLVITKDKRVISGHRRLTAAQEVGVDSVPVRVSEFDSDLAEREALIEFNRQREKTPGQIVNEFDEMLEIEKQRAEERVKEAGSVGGKGSEEFHNPSKGRSTDKAAEKVNADVSGRTLEKGKKVKDKAEKGDETAQEQWDKLQSGDTSFHRAHKEVEKSEAEEQVQEQKESEQTQTAYVRQQNAIDFLEQVDTPNLLIADPPYTTDVENIREFAESWVPTAIDTLNDESPAFITIGAYPDELQAYLNVLEGCGVRDRTQVMVWTYRNTLGQTPNDEYKLNWQAILFIQPDPAVSIDSPKTSEQWAVQDINAPDGRFGEGRHHKWQKPSELINRFIRHMTDEGDTVIDPFVGTGTTVLEAAELGREAIGSDIDEDMLEIAVERGCKYE